MLKFTKYTFILLSAVYFLFAGTGYNIVKYCCGGCKVVRIETKKQNSYAMKAVAQKSSCCDKDEKCEPDKKMCRNHLNHQSKDCSFKRVGVDIPLIQTETSINNNIVKYIKLFNVAFIKHYSFKNIEFRTIYPPPSDTFSNTGREILALKAVLVI